MTETKTLLERLSAVQNELKVPKGQRNSFGNYNYRNAEDILEAVKPLLAEHALVLTLSDELVQVGERYYVKATASIVEASRGIDELKSYENMALGIREIANSLSFTGWAREEEIKKGMDGSQITGASSSYARKYALNGLFLIDDTKDSDATNDHGKAQTAPKGAIQAVQGPAGGPGPLIHPSLMNELRKKLKAADLTGDLATAFVKNTLGYETPKTNEDAQKLLTALDELNPLDLEMP